MTPPPATSCNSATCSRRIRSASTSPARALRDADSLLRRVPVVRFYNLFFYVRARFYAHLASGALGSDLTRAVALDAKAAFIEVEARAVDALIAHALPRFFQRAAES